MTLTVLAMISSSKVNYDVPCTINIIVLIAVVIPRYRRYVFTSGSYTWYKVPLRDVPRGVAQERIEKQLRYCIIRI